jgi:GNAT superfamily N-acetyltransferase
VRAHSGYIFNVSVNKSYRRRGVARKLMTFMEQVIMARGREWSVLQVDRGNEPAERLYQQLGYRSHHPHFLRREIRPPISKALTGGMTIERLRRRPGHDLYVRYLNIERQKGDYWAASIVDEYESRSGAAGVYWRCRLYDQEAGCARVIGREDRPLIRLALNPEYWGHAAIGGLAKELVDVLPGRPDFIDLFLESSAHHRAAAPILNGLGFQERCRSRLLMLKPLANDDSERPAADGQAQ